MTNVSLTTSQTNPILTKFLSMFDKNRSRVLEQLQDVTDEMLDYSPDMETVETIGTLLYHIAGVDWSWVFEDLDGKEMEYEKWKYSFALRPNNEEVDQLRGKGKQFYLDLIKETREEIIERLQQFTDGDLQREFHVADTSDFTFTLEWMLFHLINHEAQHQGQISLMKRLYRLEHDMV